MAITDLSPEEQELLAMCDEIDRVKAEAKESIRVAEVCRSFWNYMKTIIGEEKAAKMMRDALKEAEDG